MRKLLVFLSLGLTFVYSGCVTLDSPQNTVTEPATDPVATTTLEPLDSDGDGIPDTQENPLEQLDLSKACECPATQLLGKSLEVTASTSGSLITTAKLFLNSTGDIEINFAPFSDPTTGQIYTASDTDKIKFKVVTNTTGEICGFPSTPGINTASKADIAFILDTTGSMGPRVSTMADSINAFAASLSAASLDVKYAALTVGDAFATKKSTGSSYTLGAGIAEPPTFDTVERPFFNFTASVVDFKAFVDQVKTVIGGGSGGLGATENYAGAAVAAAGKSPNVTVPNFTFFTPRKDALQYQIVIGDNHAYSAAESGDGITGVFVPPAKADLAAKFAGVKVHTVSLQDPVAALNPGNLISLKEMSDASSGTYVNIGPTGTVDLNVLKIADLIKNFWKVNLSGGCFGSYASFTVNASLQVQVTPTEKITQYFNFVVNVTP